ncbi:MAG: protein kinase [Planctomycetes bacterium]|nr:protein kinase [Planctomycetota bacterium]
MAKELANQSKKRRLGDFEIIRELGRGGMGIVYEARQRSLNRKVALKVLSSGLGMTAKAVIRFRREAETAAKLHHTNIVPIHATGEEDGVHYYAMELVDGPSLNFVIRHMRDQRRSAEPKAQTPSTPPIGSDSTVAVSPRHAAPAASLEDPATSLPDWVAQTMTMESGSDPSASGTSVGESSSTLTAGHSFFDNIARMIADVADALGYAHSQNVVHRDMKPSNLLLSPDGRVSINDFGLARMLEQPGMTTTGEFMGSPLYMSPEQITAGRAPLDHRTDIYSLGATLYELLTLQPPFLGERRDQIIGQIMHKEPRSPRSVNKKIPVDLETICLKAMEKDPDRRYQTGEEMAEDLRRFVNRFAISAKRAGLVGRATKWVRRHPAVAALFALVIVTGSVAGLFAYNAQQSQLRIIAIQRDNAKEKAILAAMNGEFDAAEVAIQDAETRGASVGWVRMLRGQVALHQGRPKEAIEHLEQAVRLLPDVVAARAMLVLAVQEDGRWDQAFMMLEDLESLTPKTAEDHLFLGLASSMTGAVDRGVDALDEAVRKRPGSPMARVVRAQVRSWRATDTADLADVAAALDDARTAKSMLPNASVALQAHLFAHLVAANVYEELGEDAKRAAVLAEAEQDVLALERFAGLPTIHEGLAKYFEYLGDESRVRNEWRVAWQCENASDEAFRQYAFALYRQGEHDQALSVLDQLAGRSDSSHGELVRAFILMFMSRPDAPETARAAYDRATGSDGSSVLLLWYQTILRLLGDEAAVLEACPILTERFARLPDWVLEWYQHVVDFHCCKITVDELLAKAGSSRMHQCEAYFLAGVASLAKGDRAGAARYFQGGIDTRVFRFWDWDWSRMFLAKLKQDPTWPPWIPMLDSEALPKNTDRPSSTQLETNESR